MKKPAPAPVSARELQTLADFRHQLRRFLHFSEEAAARAALQPQQHQLLLQIAGAPAGVATTVGYLADRLGLKHNSVVELGNRCAEAGLILRRQGEPDRRRVLLELTGEGRQVLDSLSIDHARELKVMAPDLISTLTAIQAPHGDAEGERREGPDEG